MSISSVFEYFGSEWIFHLPPGHGRIALTFDDGPDENTTPRILDALEYLKIPATFFVVGNKCITNSQIVQQIESENHSIANHGFWHERHLYYNASKQMQSIQLTDRCLRSIGLFPLPVFRPPYGSFNLQTHHVLKTCGYTGILWSVMIGDWKKQDKDFLWRKLKSRLHDGAIIVLHDSPAALENVLFILPRLAEEIRNRNWKFVKLGEVFSTETKIKNLLPTTT